MSEVSRLKENGQHSSFNGYGGIEEIDTYVNKVYGAGWTMKTSRSVSGIPSFKQSGFGPNNVNNCTLASITRIMKYFSDNGYSRIPSDINEIYCVVRKIGVRHGYDHEKSGLFRDLFVYTPFEINTMVKDAWSDFGYTPYKARNKYVRKLRNIKDNIDNMKPLLLNITTGDYKGHTVTVAGYRTYCKQGCSDMDFIQIYDGWSEKIRFIDWKKFGYTLANITIIK